MSTSKTTMYFDNLRELPSLLTNETRFNNLFGFDEESFPCYNYNYNYTTNINMSDHDMYTYTFENGGILYVDKNAEYYADTTGALYKVNGSIMLQWEK